MNSFNEFIIQIYGPPPIDGRPWLVGVSIETPRRIRSSVTPLSIEIPSEVLGLSEEFFAGRIEWGDLITLGRLLGGVAFPTDFRQELYDCVQDQYDPLRITFRFSPSEPHLIHMPWEVIRSDLAQSPDVNPLEANFLSLHSNVSIVRQLIDVTLAKPEKRRSRRGLAVYSGTPPRRTPLNLKGEASAISIQAKSRNIVLEDTHSPRYKDISTALRNKRSLYDFFHFSGHGEVDSMHDGGGAIILMDDPPLTAQEMATLCLGNGIPLVVLNACESARVMPNSVRGPAIATALFRTGISCVVGMQREISARAATAFMTEFYKCVINKLSIDEAVIAGRLAVRDAARTNSNRDRARIEAFTPVLYRYHERSLYSDIEFGPSNDYAGQLESKRQIDSRLISKTIVRIIGILVVSMGLLAFAASREMFSLSRVLLFVGGWLFLVSGVSTAVLVHCFTASRLSDIGKAIQDLEPIEESLRQYRPTEIADSEAARRWVDDKVAQHRIVEDVLSWMDSKQLLKRVVPWRL